MTAAAPSPIEIFRIGRQTAMSGAVLDFSAAVLQAAVDAYDPAVHEAPLVVGHPTENGPAYGWVGKLAMAGDVMTAMPTQVDPDFAELVNAGRYKRVSASFYTPDSPANPKPGQYYLRHVGFLGAQPPAVKGLKAASFASSDEGVVEFADWGLDNCAAIFRRLREWLIGQHDLATADGLIPDWQIRSIEEAARIDDTPAEKAYPSYGEHTMTPDKIAELERQQAELKTQQDALNVQLAEFAEREKTIAARETEQRLQAAQDFGEKLVSEARLPASLKATAVSLLAGLGAVPFGAQAPTAVQFGEGDQAKTRPAAEVLQELLSAMPAQVEFREVAGNGAAVAKAGEHGLSDAEVANRATALKNKRAASGRVMSFAEAVDEINSNPQATE